MARVVPMTKDILSRSVTFRAVCCRLMAPRSLVFSSWMSLSAACRRLMSPKSNCAQAN